MLRSFSKHQRSLQSFGCSNPKPPRTPTHVQLDVWSWGFAYLLDGAGCWSGGRNELVQGVSHCSDAQSAPSSWQLAPPEGPPACGLTCKQHVQSITSCSFGTRGIGYF